MEKLRVDVWSDTACPWCYVGKRRLEAALADFPHRDQVEIVWRAFELDPSAPRVSAAASAGPAVPYAERLARKYGMSTAKAEAAIANLTQVAAGDGLDFHFERVKPGNTFDAHRVLHLAHQTGGGALQGAVKERLLRGYMTEGAALSDPETLIRLGAEAGLDADQVRATLASDAFAGEVRADEAEASRLGIQGVPFFAVAQRYGVSGAQPSETLLEVLTKAWGELEEERASVSGYAEGAVCGPEGCA